MTVVRGMKSSEERRARGHWQRRSATLWVFQVDARGRIAGYAMRRDPRGPSGPDGSRRATWAWDAVVASETGGPDTTIRAGVTLEQAQAAVEGATL